LTIIKFYFCRNPNRLYRLFIRPFFFLFDAETAHYLTLNIFKILLKIPFAKTICKAICTMNKPELKVTLFGIEFPNKVGLAAGFDKNARYLQELACLGFGHIEIGTVTPLPQTGNDKPRLFRLPKDGAIINRMGFNNDGMTAIANRLKTRPKGLIVGGNIGKNKITPNEEAANDYIKCFNGLFDYVDYFTVNVSSPNTPGLRALQEKQPLMHILNELQKINRQKNRRKPILLKIAPDLTEQQLDDIVEIVSETKIDGVIATNTTIERNNLTTTQNEIENTGAGGLSGKPLMQKSTSVIQYLADKSEHAFPIIGVGGIMNGNDAKAKIEAGAQLVQVYTGFIYEGPMLAKKICKSLLI
jgi:dihydroorotate dehydrogenase